MDDLRKRIPTVRLLQHFFASLSARKWPALLLFCILAARAADYKVSQDGSGTFTTIQSCANAVHAGDRCLVSPGTYNEHVQTKSGGTADDDAHRVIFKANGGIVIMQGFYIKHPYVTVDGFNMQDLAGGDYAIVDIAGGASYCNILNNTIGPDTAKMMGMQFTVIAGITPGHCTIRGNTFKGLSYVYLMVRGDGHLFEGNYMQDQNGNDFIDLWGNGSTFRRNVFWHGNSQTGNHPDWLQIWGDSNGAISANHLFEQNMIFDLQNSQVCQLNAASPLYTPVPYPGYGNITFRRNIIVSVHDNANFGLPGTTFENNTTYRLAYNTSGIALNVSLTRGAPTPVAIKNNVFLAAGNTPDANPGTSGFYGYGGAALTQEVVWAWITQNPTHTYGATEAGIWAALKSSGYIDGNGYVLAPAFQLAALGDPATCGFDQMVAFVFPDSYVTYKQRACNAVVQTAAMDKAFRAAFQADYNYVGGSQLSGYPPKKSSQCPAIPTENSLVQFNFCEPHGINGGDPKLANLADILGPDGVPFTLDDGLKPLPGSPLCGKGEGGVDIGAYSCDPGKVFPTDVGPLPPTKLSTAVR